MPENPPLQKRTGYNQGEQSLRGIRTRYLGQPAIKAGPGDTVIFKNSPDIPGKGQKNIRSQMHTLFAAGVIFNRTGRDIDYDLLLVDPDGKEFPFFMDTLGIGTVPIPNGDQNVIPSFGLLSLISNFGNGIPLPILPLDWSLVLRVNSGNPASGKGLIVWTWAQDCSRNLQALIVPITTAEVELGPEPGRAWQLIGSKKSFAPVGPTYYNFDSIVRTVEKEVYHLAGEDIQVNVARGDIAVSVRADDTTGIERGFLTEVGIVKKPKGLVLAYPDKIKIKGKEAQSQAPLYALVPFAEFDLPSDMHVEE